MNQVLIATKNEGKVKEFKALFQQQGIAVLSLLDIPDAPNIKEIGTTFEDNAIFKAETIANHLGKMAIADDSGIVIDALGGRPGVFSARYAGEKKNDDANIDKVLRELKGVPLSKRIASFQCVIAKAAPGEKTELFSGHCMGLVTLERAGKGGFGYDSIFYLPQKGKTMAELSSDEKNQISHRAAALQKLMESFQSMSIRHNM